jgi:hypothetical protein
MEETMTDHGRCATPEVDRTRTLNDALRTSLTGGSVMLTRAVAALGAEAQREILEAVSAMMSSTPTTTPMASMTSAQSKLKGRASFSKSIITTSTTRSLPLMLPTRTSHVA